MMDVASQNPFSQESGITNMDYIMLHNLPYIALRPRLPHKIYSHLFQTSVAVEELASTWCHYNLYVLCKPGSLLVPGGCDRSPNLLVEWRHRHGTLS